MSGRNFADFLAEGIVGLIVLYVVLLAWFFIKALELIVRVTTAHPTNRVLWAGVGVVVVSLLLAGLAQFQSPPLNTLAWVNYWGLALLAKVVEIYYDQLLLREWSRAEVAHAVTHEPWWSI